jgi:hypothetical protein
MKHFSFDVDFFSILHTDLVYNMEQKSFFNIDCAWVLNYIRFDWRVIKWLIHLCRLNQQNKDHLFKNIIRFNDKE